MADLEGRTSERDLPSSVVRPVSTEDRQSPEDSIAWQRATANALIEAHGGEIIADYLDIGVSRSLPWSRRPEAAAHPNREKARLGATLNRLEPSPDTAPVVQRIFAERSAGRGYGAIAAGLNQDRIPSPAARDPARNPHRDPRGWAESAVRAIVHNPRYTGHEVWARQRRDYELVDPAAPADGHVRRMRWSAESDWVWSPEPMHEALVSRTDWERARLPRGEARRPRGPKPTSRQYPLRGRVRCAVCGRSMHGETRSRRRYYRCPVPRSYPPASQDHPRSVYVREDALLRALDEWIAELFAPERVTETAQRLVEAAGDDAERTGRADEARRRLNDAGRQLAQYRSALDTGGDPVTISRWITEAAEQERAAQAELDAVLRAGPPPLTVDNVETAVRELGGLVAILEQADAADRADLYEALGVGAKYDAATHTAVLKVEPAWGQLRVGGGTCGLTPRIRLERAVPLAA